MSPGERRCWLSAPRSRYLTPSDRTQNSNIKSFGDAVWWAITTTVGYGDHYPVTGLGRLVAFGLMVGGVALLGTVSATLASWLIETVAAENEQAEDLQESVRRLEAKVDLLTGEQRQEPDTAERNRPARDG